MAGIAGEGRDGWRQFGSPPEGDQRHELPGGHWAEVGPRENGRRWWYWAVLARKAGATDLVQTVASGSTGTEDAAKRAALDWSGKAFPAGSEDQLEKLCVELLALVQQPVLHRGREITRERWEIKVRAKAAELFRLGYGIGGER